MSGTPELAAPVHIAAPVHNETFALNEYNSITQVFSSGLNAMAVLLILFFIFTGAMLNYVGGLFTELSKTDIHPIGFWHLDFRIWQIYFIIVVALVLTVWSLCFVLVFRDIAGKMFQRASEIEAIYPDLSSRKEKRVFVLLHGWYSTSSGFSPLRLLFWSTVTFYFLIFASYGAIAIAALKFRPAMS